MNRSHVNRCSVLWPPAYRRLPPLPPLDAGGAFTRSTPGRKAPPSSIRPRSFFLSFSFSRRFRFPMPLSCTMPAAERGRGMAEGRGEGQWQVQGVGSGGGQGGKAGLFAGPHCQQVLRASWPVQNSVGPIGPSQCSRQLSALPLLAPTHLRCPPAAPAPRAAPASWPCRDQWRLPCGAGTQPWPLAGPAAPPQTSCATSCPGRWRLWPHGSEDGGAEGLGTCIAGRSAGNAGGHEHRAWGSTAMLPAVQGRWDEGCRQRECGGDWRQPRRSLAGRQKRPPLRMAVLCARTQVSCGAPPRGGEAGLPEGITPKDGWPEQQEGGHERPLLPRTRGAAAPSATPAGGRACTGQLPTAHQRVGPMQGSQRHRHRLLLQQQQQHPQPHRAAAPPAASP